MLKAFPCHRFESGQHSDEPMVLMLPQVSLGEKQGLTLLRRSL